ncbi:MAG: rod shape-determining protein MreD [Firmicutes bacterium]|nr:rod shape-determining protein MreD [Bacillota bacterium]
MHLVVIGLVLFISVILQATVLPHLQIFGIKPDLVSLVVVAFALFRGRYQGAAVGISGGLMIDFLRGDFLGLSALSKGIVGFLLGTMEERVFNDDFIIPVVTAFAGTLADQLLFLILGDAFGLDYPVWPGIFAIALPTALYTAMLMPLFYNRLYGLNRRLIKVSWEVRRKLF